MTAPREVPFPNLVELGRLPFVDAVRVLTDWVIADANAELSMLRALAQTIDVCIEDGGLPVYLRAALKVAEEFALIELERQARLAALEEVESKIALADLPAGTKH